MTTPEKIQDAIKRFHEAQQRAALPTEAQKVQGFIEQTEREVEQINITLGVCAQKRDQAGVEAAKEKLRQLESDLQELRAILAGYKSGAISEPPPEGKTPEQVAEEIHVLIRALRDEMWSVYNERVSEAMAAKQAYLDSLGAIGSAEVDISNLGLLYGKIRPYVAAPMAAGVFRPPGLWTMGPGSKPLVSRLFFEENELFEAYGRGGPEGQADDKPGGAR